MLCVHFCIRWYTHTHARARAHTHTHTHVKWCCLREPSKYNWVYSWFILFLTYTTIPVYTLPNLLHLVSFPSS
jgi:hypothetical protein